MIDLRRGHPPTAELPPPWQGLRGRGRTCQQCRSRLQSARAPPLLQPPGHAAAVAERRYGSSARDGLFATTASRPELCAAALAEPGDEVVMEAPTYFRPRKSSGPRPSIRSAGRRGRPRRERSSGRSGGNGAAEGLYVVPRHGSPSGASLDKDRRAKLAPLARGSASFAGPACTTSRLVERSLAAPRVRRGLRLGRVGDGGDARTPPRRRATPRRRHPDARVVSISSFSKVLARRSGSRPRRRSFMVARRASWSRGGCAPFTERSARVLKRRRGRASGRDAAAMPGRRGGARAPTARRPAAACRPTGASSSGRDPRRGRDGGALRDECAEDVAFPSAAPALHKPPIGDGAEAGFRTAPAAVVEMLYEYGRSARRAGLRDARANYGKRAVQEGVKQAPAVTGGAACPVCEERDWAPLTAEERGNDTRGKARGRCGAPGAGGT